MKFIKSSNFPYAHTKYCYITYNHILNDKYIEDKAIIIDRQLLVVSMHFINYHTIKLVDHYKID
jgi:hypothetical protein